MNALAILSLSWLILPFLLGFTIYLLPRFNRYLVFGIASLSALFGLALIVQAEPLLLQLIDSFGVTLQIDSLSGYFILMNGMVTAAVVSYCFTQNKSPFFYTQLVILHGAVNAVFICADFISLYVALETIGIASFLLITYTRTDQSLWVGLRYLFISNTSMLFYLIGAVLVYQASHSFAFQGLADAPPEAIALIFLGLLTKGGIFVSGLWLPLTHAEAATPVSAMLSGVVIKAGVFPLLRCALVVEEIDPIVRLLGISTALFGVVYAIFEKDVKRMLAFHTLSQLGFVLAAPVVGGFYALTHGLVKSALFLSAGQLSSRNFKELKQISIPTPLWIALLIASFSISGLPFFAGFGAKTLTIKNLLPWQEIAINMAAVGTAISFAKFIFLPRQDVESESTQWGYWGAMVILLGGLFITNVFYLEAYKLANIPKALITVAVGWFAYWLIFQKITFKMPRMMEKFEHVIGMMSIVLTGLFWVTFA
jgi:multicomponent Na+:H+ antiporter subunit D